MSTSSPSLQTLGILSLPLFSYSIGTQSSLAPSPRVSRCCKTKRFLQSATDASFHTDPSWAKCSLMQDRWATRAKGVISVTSHWYSCPFCSFPRTKESRAIAEIKKQDTRDWQRRKPTRLPQPTNKNKIKISLPNGWQMPRFCNGKFISLADSLLFPVIE